MLSMVQDLESHIKSDQLGGELLSSTEDTKKRWVEHFKNLLNQPSHYHQDIVNDIAQLPTIDNLMEYSRKYLCLVVIT